MNCSRCGSTDVITIPVQLGDGSRLEFIGCHRCESKFWRSEAKTVTLREVLDLTSAHRPR